jgi:hypothetical protein
MTRTEARRLIAELAERAQASRTIKGLPRLLRILGIKDLDDRKETTKRHLSHIGVDPDSVKEPAESKKKAAASSAKADSTRAKDSEVARRSATRTQPIPNFSVIKGGPDAVR